MCLDLGSHSFNSLLIGGVNLAWQYELSTYAEVGLRSSLLMFIVVKQFSSDVYSSKG